MNCYDILEVTKNINRVREEDLLYLRKLLENQIDYIQINYNEAVGSIGAGTSPRATDVYMKKEILPELKRRIKETWTMISYVIY
jgi:hypothetical protein